jgi:hypothetical protein
MTPTATGHRRLRIWDRREAVGDGLLAALALVGLVSVSAFDRPLTFVDHIEIVNPTVFQVEVDVRSARARDTTGDGWMALGGIRRESRRTLDEILDQGERWTFRFSYGGVVAGEVTLGRAQIETVTIPGEVAARLAEAGFAPSAF